MAETLSVEIDARTLRSFEIGAWRTNAGGVDVLLGIPGASSRDLVRYERLAENTVELRIDRIRTLVASLADIIRSKEVTDRPKDREAVDGLRFSARWAINRVDRQLAVALALAVWSASMVGPGRRLG